ncbi:ExbD/TolR family protein [Thalassotalea maritima]|uniref:ExbD/TolR family protein n=1 Tax=Thalassotalea maritima TaxID=3242416 RepID=UPI003529B0FB
MARRKRDGMEEEAGVDMTPMLDIVFIMLIFFIVTTSFVKEQGLDLQRPESAQKKSDNKNPSILIKVDSVGTITINNRVTDVERISANLEFLLADISVSNILLTADEDTKHETIVAIMDQIKDIDGLRVSVITKSD